MELLWNVIRVYDERPGWSGVFQVASSEQWALRLLPSLWKDRLFQFGNSQEPILEFLDQFPAEGTRSIDDALFTDYLCSICALVTQRPMDPRLVSQQNKTYLSTGRAGSRFLISVLDRRLRTILVTELFKRLQDPSLESSLVNRIISNTAELANRTLSPEVYHGSDNFGISEEISKFCCILHKRNESPDILVAASSLGGSEDLCHFPLPDKTLSWPTEWIFTALEHLHRSIPHSPGGRRDWSVSTTMAVHGLLQILALSDARSLQHQPSTEALSMIVTALPVTAPSSQIISHLAFLVLSRARTWYLSPSLRTIMQQASVWARLGRVVSETEQSHHISHYQELGVYLADVSEWRPFIKSDIAT
ncbi:hypothetical protein B0H16DRAFT_1713021 [Mycena metata]|uniref:Uncharacterized protein n=1 Tax=Mycena metata TaxID=1033252 RepID=A0AAD7K2D3_9AGAR|nr:hypothetical protein B0H16DRAFT_1713021 [Mycena metata]